MRTINYVPEQIEQVKKINNIQEMFNVLDFNPEVLRLLPNMDLDEIRLGFYSAKYFERSQNIVRKNIPENQIVTMQIFQKTQWAVIAGVDLVVNLLKLVVWEYNDFNFVKNLLYRKQQLKEQIKQMQALAVFNPAILEQINKKYQELLEIQKQINNQFVSAIDKVQIEVLKKDGEIANWVQEPVLKIKGPYRYFAILESIYLGILARATKVATNTKKVIEAANWKPVWFFADRFDLYSNQMLDGYAALLAGVNWVATDAQWYFDKIPWIWTMPHALIANFNGDTAKATLEFAKTYPDIPTIALVDFNNNCAEDAIKTAKLLKENGLKLEGVRLDTSGTMVDEGILFSNEIMKKYFAEKTIYQIREDYQTRKSERAFYGNTAFSKESLEKLKKAGLTGVNSELVNFVRNQLNQAGFEDVKIFVSGGFDAEKIEKFEKENVPVDGYGVGSSLLTPKYVESNWDFTADIVSINGKAVAKVGRMEY